MTGDAESGQRAPTSPIGRSVGIAVTAAWGLVAVAIVVANTAGAGDVAPEVTDEAVGLWALFLPFVFLPSYVFWLDVREARR